MSEMSGAFTWVASDMSKVNDQLNDLENRSANPDTSSFTKILKQTLEDSKKDPYKGTTEVVDGGRKRTVQDHQVLVVKPKTTSRQVSLPETALASVPVNRFTMTGLGSLVVRLPTKEARIEAGNAINQYLGTDRIFSVSEPKKVLPKSTLVGISPFTDNNDIIPSILNKNPRIKSAVDEGCTFNLLFTILKNNAHTKIAVVKIVS